GVLEPGDAVLEIDGTFYDELAFEAVEGASIVITMRSAEFDPYLHLIGPDGRQIAHRGTPPGEPSSTAEIIVVAPESGEYRIYANALEPDMTGP
ncbi:MAG: serine protease, partial [Actinobacteria bacterium]|nr:serine protease [Actinomycetota bacterium]NIU71852.1 serine protease [Actinomycetota bacterium]NIW33798.1 serine protease [Actinomycetota bacterium]NIX25898.1 serine protease [Actinomycetota bacterium]